MITTGKDIAAFVSNALEKLEDHRPDILFCPRRQDVELVEAADEGQTPADLRFELPGLLVAAGGMRD